MSHLPRPNRAGRLSKVPELRKLQLLAGLGVCAICLKPLKPPGQARRIFICFSADCRMEEDRIRARFRSLRSVVADIGRSVRRIERVVAR